jgi:hypothetical protein
MKPWPWDVLGFYHVEVQLQYRNGERYGSRYATETCAWGLLIYIQYHIGFSKSRRQF